MNSNTNLRRLVTLAIMAGLSVVLVFLIHFPIFPAAPFLEYDPADIPILIGTFMYGPLAGFLITLVAAVVQGLTVSAQSGFYGIVMHILSTGSFVLLAGFVYHIKRNRIGAVAGLAGGMILSAAVMAVANLLLTPAYLSAVAGLPQQVADETVRSLLLPVIVPFNLIKAGINGILTFLLYKRLSNLIKGKRKDEG